MPKLTQARLKELLHYCPETGVWTRLVSLSNSVKDGDQPKNICKINGYRRLSVDGVRYRSNRLAWLYMEGYFPEHEVEHKNRIRQDDRWQNLRVLTHACNARNCNLRKSNRTGVAGVSIHPNGKFFSYIKLESGKKHLGYFVKLVDAAMARWMAEKEHGFPTCSTTSTAYLYLKERGLL